MIKGLPEDVWIFIKRNIDSVEQLEILLLLFRTAPKQWTINRVCQEIRTSLSSTQHRLNTLAKAGLIEVIKNNEDELFQYKVDNAENHNQVVTLEQEYKLRRVSIIEAIYKTPSDKMMEFMDAFKIRKSDKDD